MKSIIGDIDELRPIRLFDEEVEKSMTRIMAEQERSIRSILEKISVDIDGCRCGIIIPDNIDPEGDVFKTMSQFFSDNNIIRCVFNEKTESDASGGDFMVKYSYCQGISVQGKRMYYNSSMGVCWVGIEPDGRVRLEDMNNPYREHIADDDWYRKISFEPQGIKFNVYLQSSEQL